MQRLSQLMGPFSISDIPADVIAKSDQAARDYHAKDAERQRRRAVERSQVPTEYQGASLEGMPRLERYAARFTARSKPDESLLLLGIAGCGKTYAACAVAMDVLERCEYVRFVTAPGYIAELQDAMDGRSSRADVFAKYAEARLLVVDDLGKGKATDWSTGEIWRLVNERGAYGRPTVITTQYTEDGLLRRLSEGSDKESAEAIVSRLFDKRKYARMVPGSVDRRRS